jgi:Transposase DNA-binding
MSKDTETKWSEEEFSNVNFGDERLNKRAIKLVEQLATQPQAFINQACEDWADAKAAYRFFDNEKVQPGEIIAAHRKRVEEGMRNQKVVLAIQDTTEFDYTAHPRTQGLGRIGDDRETAQGLFMHTTVAVTEEGLPLGVLTQHIGVRDKQSRRQGQNNEHKRVAIEDKESAKCINALEHTLGSVPCGVQVGTICDREADIYEFLLLAEKLEAQYVVRASWDRRLMAEEKWLLEKLAKCRAAGEFEVEVAAKKQEPARRATVKVGFKQIKLRPPQRLKRVRMQRWKPVSVYGVYVKEM